MSFRLNRAIGLGAALLALAWVLPEATQNARHLAPGSKAANWPQYGFDGGHSNFYPYEKSIGKQNVTQLQLSWSTNPNVIQSEGYVADKGAIYALSANDGKLYAVNVQDGSVRWSTSQLLGNGVPGDSVPAVAGKVVIVPCSVANGDPSPGGLCGIRASDGSIKWNANCPVSVNCGVSSPAIDGKLAFYHISEIISDANQEFLAAVNAKSGKLVWDVATSPYHCPDTGRNNDLPVPVANGHAYEVFSCQGQQGNLLEVCAVQESSGTSDWCTDIDDQYASVIEANGTLYVTAYGPSGPYAVALDEATGAAKWTSARFADVPGATAATKNTLYIALYHGQGLLALSANTGAQLWKYTGGYASMVAANGLVYTSTCCSGGGTALIALDGKTGAKLWQSSEGQGGVNATPIILNDTIYAGCYYICGYRVP
ncbi:MAG: PQQ-binding-like beta-propeller repeat protein [Rhizomicrobium sp.]